MLVHRSRHDSRIQYEMDCHNRYWTVERFLFMYMRRDGAVFFDSMKMISNTSASLRLLDDQEDT